MCLISFLREIYGNVAAHKSSGTKDEIRSSVRIKAADNNVEEEVKQ